MQKWSDCSNVHKKEKQNNEQPDSITDIQINRTMLETMDRFCRQPLTLKTRHNLLNSSIYLYNSESSKKLQEGKPWVIEDNQHTESKIESEVHSDNVYLFEDYCIRIIIRKSM